MAPAASRPIPKCGKMATWLYADVVHLMLTDMNAISYDAAVTLRKVSWVSTFTPQRRARCSTRQLSD